MTNFVLSIQDVLRRGLFIATGKNHGPEKRFGKLYGSSPQVLADMWHALQTTDLEEAKLDKKENSVKGFDRFLMAHFFLWTYPKNAELTATRFKVCERLCRGEPIWRWVKKIQALKITTITWDPRLDSSDTEIFIMSVDGTDFRIWEPKHPTLPIDTGYCSHKFKHAALKYEVAISVATGRCVWISGPHRGGKGDLTIMREGLMKKVKAGKLVIADRGYNTSMDGEMEKMATPNGMDVPEVAKFKSRQRARHETFNGRLKHFCCLKDTFRHDIAKHQWALEAVAVTVQFQIDNGSPLFKL